jgi:hypothetical protein
MGPEGSENKGDKVVLKAKLIFMFAIRIYHILCKTFLIVQTVVEQIHEIGKIINFACNFAFTITVDIVLPFFGLPSGKDSGGAGGARAHQGHYVHRRHRHRTAAIERPVWIMGRKVSGKFHQDMNGNFFCPGLS